MVFPGTYSKACLRCKQRKVKCDEHKPGCKKCEAIGKSCSGYVEQWEAVFRSENEKVEAKVRKEHQLGDRRTKNPTLVGKVIEWVQISESIESPADRHVSGSLSTLSLGHLPSFQFEDTDIVQRFFENFVLPQKDGVDPGWLAFLPDLYAKAEEESCLSYTVKALSYASMGNITSDSRLVLQSQKLYGVALRKITKELVVPDKIARTSTLASSFLLGFYEYVLGNEKEGYWHGHGQGMQMLLRLRNKDQLEVLQDLGIYEPILCEMHRRNLEMRRAPSAEDEKLLEIHRAGPGKEMVLAVFQCSKHVAALYLPTEHHDGKSGPSSSRRLVSVSARAFDIELELIGSQLSNSAPKGETNVPVDIFPSKPTGDKHIGLFPLRLLNIYRCIRIILHEAILHTLEEDIEAKDLTTKDKNDQIQSIALIKQLTDELLATAPRLCGLTTSNYPDSSIKRVKSVGGYFLLWPLHIIIQSRVVDESQKTAARAILNNIGNTLGLGHAFDIAGVARPVYADHENQGSKTEVLFHG